MSNDPFDITKLRIDPADPALVPAKPVGKTPGRLQKQRVGFTKFPNSWKEKLRGCHGLTYHVALTLLYEYWRQGSSGPVKLPNGMLGIEGVSRHAKRRALQNLERCGLAAVQWRKGKSPLATLQLDSAEPGVEKVRG
jgi:hypothetical protein